MSKNNIKIYIADWLTENNKLTGIRRQVFIEEQMVPKELEWDEFDNSSTHFLVSYQGETVACARLQADGKIGRMAVLKEYRNQGIGHRILQFILQEAGNKKFKIIYLHAQLSALIFYEKHGFIATGDIFYEANIAHRKMCLKHCLTSA